MNNKNKFLHQFNSSPIVVARKLFCFNHFVIFLCLKFLKKRAKRKISTKMTNVNNPYEIGQDDGFGFYASRCMHDSSFMAPALVVSRNRGKRENSTKIAELVNRKK